MPQYTWACHKCETYWEREYKMGKAPEQTKCPECKKKCGRSYDTPSLRFIGPGFYVNDYGKNTIAHKSGKGACEEFIEDSKKASDKRMKTGFHNYKVYTPDFGVLEKQGQVKRTNKPADQAINDNADKHRAMAKEIYKKSGIDPEKQEKTNVDIMTRPDKEGLE